MNFDIVNLLDEVLCPKTYVELVTGKNEYNMKQFLDQLEKYIYKAEYNKKYNYVCDKEGRYYLYIDDIIPNTPDYAYDLFVYINGLLLLENEDYFRISETVIRLSFPTTIGDVFTYEVSTLLKYLLNFDENKDCANFSEKLILNDVFNKINEYAKE